MGDAASDKRTAYAAWNRRACHRRRLDHYRGDHRALIECAAGCGASAAGGKFLVY
jgi:hypothetical protein